MVVVLFQSVGGGRSGNGKMMTTGGSFLEIVLLPVEENESV